MFKRDRSLTSRQIRSFMKQIFIKQRIAIFTVVKHTLSRTTAAAHIRNRPLTQSLLHQALTNYIGGHRVPVPIGADRTRVAFSAMLAVIQRGCVSRKPASHEALLHELSIDPRSWAVILAARSHYDVEVSRGGLLTLQLLAIKKTVAQGFSKRSFAAISGTPDSVILSTIGSGAAPGKDTLSTLANHPASDMNVSSFMQAHVPHAIVTSLKSNQQHARSPRCPTTNPPPV